MELESPRLDFPVNPKDEEVPWRWRPRQEKHRDGGNQKHEESNLDKKNKELEEKHRDGGNQTRGRRSLATNSWNQTVSLWIRLGLLFLLKIRGCRFATVAWVSASRT